MQWLYSHASLPDLCHGFGSRFQLICIQQRILQLEAMIYSTSCISNYRMIMVSASSCIIFQFTAHPFGLSVNTSYTGYRIRTKIPPHEDANSSTQSCHPGKIFCTLRSLKSLIRRQTEDPSVVCNLKCRAEPKLSLVDFKMVP